MDDKEAPQNRSSNENEPPPNPYDNASFIDLLFFFWPAPLVKLGSMKVLEQSDLPQVSKDDDVYALGRNLTNKWEIEKTKGIGKASLTRALFFTHMPSNWFVGAILITESALRIYQAQILGRLIKYLLTGTNSSDQSLYDNGYFLSFILVTLGACIAFTHHHAFFHAWRLGMQLRGALTSIIFDKAVKLSLSSMSSISVGHIVNLSAQDVESFQICGCFIHFLYTPILEALAVLYFGIAEVGVAFVAGFACIILLIPVQKTFSNQLTKSKESTSKFTDERLKVLNQALTGVRLMKINGWESIFIDIIEGIREKEVAALLYTNIMRGLNEAIFFAMPIMIAAFTFITYTRLGGTLTTSKIFIVLTYFNIVQFSMSKFFSMSIASVTECYVAIKRIERLLLLNEVSVLNEDGNNNKDTVRAQSSSTLASSDAIVFKDFCGSWRPCTEALNSPNVDVAAQDDLIQKQYLYKALSVSKGDPDAENHEIDEIDSPPITPPTAGTTGTQWSRDASGAAMVLRNINLIVKKGELVVVVGSVGCGKSSLLLAALGELPPVTGTVDVAVNTSGTRGFAYCAQNPFILSSTVRANILFNLPYDEQRYKEAVECCALTTDFSLFVHGDMTIIGDKGINLSGGQKARVGLARAMYANKDLYLLDDPLSAVDTHVGAHLFEKAICELTRAGKTVLLATHQVQYLKSPCVSKVVVVDEGSIVATGLFDELVSMDAISSLLQDFTKNDENEDEQSGVAAITSANFTLSLQEHDPDDEDETKSSPRGRQNSSVSYTSLRKSSIDQSVHSVHSKQGENDDKKMNTEISGILVEEDKESGSVQPSTYFEYGANLGGFWSVVYLLVIMASAQVLSILANYWLSFWSSKSATEQQDLYYVHVYIGIVVGAVVASVTRAIVVFHACIKASQKLHNKLLGSVIRTKILFFDSNPIGRILNRFAKDVAFSDDLMPSTLYDCVQCVMMCIGAILVVCSAVPYIFISLIPLILFFIKLRSYFLLTSREVKRLESLSRSPIFSHLTESLDGVITIRAFDQIGQFQRQNKELMNCNVRGYFSFVAIARWLGFNLDATVIGLLLASTFGAVLAKNYNAGINNAAISVGIMYIIQLTGLFQWAVRQSAEVESLMVSIERILAYSRLETEGELHGPADVGTETSSRPHWPEQGKIEAVNLTASYREDLPPVLKNISFILQPGMRVGIVGRSGCGKSTLVATLLRLCDITGGAICIDGVDITTIGLHDLRRKISVIQQNPFLFSGSIRQNLDPWGKYSDVEIWSALDCVCLKSFVEKFELGLEYLIEEGGQNFSAGEKQLVCLARAILQRNRILIMDEATASIDNDTDMRVQQAIYEQFTKKGYMVLSVAHRLVNICDFDMILVLDSGILHEAGHPHELLSKYLPEPSLTSDAAESLSEKMSDIPKASFASLVLQTGDEMSLRLRRMAFSASKSFPAEKSN